ncbi:MAG TPA: flagellar biosynthetic protein FliO [Candidatus Kryptobacter bacterium]|nr:flagellar biosynthetic protein FliO [Candidatus Kryptobacter bacterium]
MDWLIVKTFLTMLVLIGMMFGLLLVVRKYFYTKPQFVNDNLKVLSSMSLQPKKSIYLVKVFDRVMLVGVSDNSIASLGEITDADVLQKLESSGQKQGLKGFSEILRAFTQK